MYAIRSYYALVSNEVPFNRVNPQHSISRVGVIFNTSKSFDNLRPEKIRSLELGTDWKFWDNRLGVEFRITSYNVCYTKLLRSDDHVEPGKTIEYFAGMSSRGS